MTEPKLAAAERANRRRRNDRWMIALACAGFMVLLVIAGWGIVGEGPAKPAATADTAKQPPNTIEGPGSDRPQSARGAAGRGTNPPPASAELVIDDGRTMWVSPTAGRPLDWAYLPPGVQMVLALRPAAMIRHVEGEKALAALGPLGAEGVRWIEEQTGQSFGRIDRLTIAWRLEGDGKLAATLVAFAADGVPPTPATWEESQAGAIKHSYAAQSYWQVGDRAYYRPKEAPAPTVVATSIGAIEQIIDLQGTGPPLRRDVARLLTHTDTDRQVSLVVAPNLLFGEGGDVFDGGLARLRRPVSWFLGDGLSAAALSLHWGDDFFIEAIAIPTLEVPAVRAAEHLTARVTQLPELIEQYVVDMAADPHGRRVVARLPAMTRKLATYTRSGFDRAHVVLRCYLPAIAGHNLLMGAELVLAETPGSGTRIAGGPAGEVAAPLSRNEQRSVLESLQRSTTLRMPRDTLEAALAQLAGDVGVEIVIRGPDLQLDGITKNQSLAIDLQDRPGEEILVEILRKANPDKSAAGPADQRQKLVYVVGPKSPDGPEVIFVTTRAAAAGRGETLPAVFTAPTR